MRTIRGGNYSWRRVGFSLYVPESLPGPELYLPTGNDRVLPGGAREVEWRFPGYPIVIDRDTCLLGGNFAQESPHTAGIFRVEPGVRLALGVLEEGLVAEFDTVNLENVTIPDEVAFADIGPVRNVQVEYLPPAPGATPMPYLHECAVCATFTAALRAEIAAGRYQLNRRLGLIKPIARGRREFDWQVTEDLAALTGENAAARAAAAALLP